MIRSKSMCSTIANAFAHFLKFYYPELPPRRAFFLAQGSQRVVYTYSSPRLEEDLRHEATHALLRGSFGDLPLWLDEGLAEYFETDLAQPGAGTSASIRSPTTSRRLVSRTCQRLESLSDIRQMTPRDYREAWAWVHLFLNGSEPGKSVLLTSLAELDRKAGHARLSRRKERPPNDVLAHSSLRTPGKPFSTRFERARRRTLRLSACRTRWPSRPARESPQRGFLRGCVEPLTKL